MKTFLLILLLSVNIFASLSSINESYKQLNSEIDKISINLAPEDKLTLYYHILSTYEKISTSIVSDQAKIETLKKLEERTLELLSTLHEHNSKLSSNDIEKLKKLYLTMNIDAFRTIHNNSIEPELSLFFTISLIIFGTLIGLIIGFFIFKEKTINAIEEIKIVTKSSDIEKIASVLKSQT